MVKQAYIALSLRAVLLLIILAAVSALTAFFFGVVPGPEVAEPIRERKVCPPESIAMRVQRAEAIFIGIVEGVLPSGNAAEVWVRPSTWYKGMQVAPSGDLRIVAHPAAAAAASTSRVLQDDLHFATGQPAYLLFLRRGPEGRFITSRCFGSRLFGSGLTDNEREALGEGRVL